VAGRGRPFAERRGGRSAPRRCHPGGRRPARRVPSRFRYPTAAPLIPPAAGRVHDLGERAVGANPVAGDAGTVDRVTGADGVDEAAAARGVEVARGLSRHLRFDARRSWCPTPARDVPAWPHPPDAHDARLPAGPRHGRRGGRDARPSARLHPARDPLDLLRTGRVCGPNAEPTQKILPARNVRRVA
jgi:hypothetical protein